MPGRQTGIKSIALDNRNVGEFRFLYERSRGGQLRGITIETDDRASITNRLRQRSQNPHCSTPQVERLPSGLDVKCSKKFDGRGFPYLRLQAQTPHLGIAA